MADDINTDDRTLIHEPYESWEEVGRWLLHMQLHEHADRTRAALLEVADAAAHGEGITAEDVERVKARGKQLEEFADQFLESVAEE
jgi:hypothetical protein